MSNAVEQWEVDKSIDAEISAVERQRYELAMQIAWRIVDPDSGESHPDLLIEECKNQGIRLSQMDAESILEFCKNAIIGESHD